MISWVSFKVLLPVALVFAAYFFLSGRRESWTRAAAIFLANVALVCWLFFPLSALVSSYVENAYTGPVYEEQMARVNGSAAQMETMELEMNRELEQAAPAQEEILDNKRKSDLHNIIDRLIDNNGRAFFSQISSEMKQKYSDFIPKNFGCNSFKKMMEKLTPYLKKYSIGTAADGTSMYLYRSVNKK